MSEYRLVWFQHFHKAAGSTVMRLGRLNGERFYPDNQNGNPYDHNGRLLPLWQYSKKALSEFIDHCERNRISMVATEWGAPDLKFLSDDPRVKLVTLLRDPWSRLVSNYTYDMISRYENLMPIRDYYYHHSLSFRQPNYYCRTLLQGLGRTVPQDGLSLVEQAMHALKYFDFAANVSSAGAMEALCHSVGWRFQEVSVNQKPNPLVGGLRAARRGDLGYAVRRARTANGKWSGIPDFRAEFEEANAADRTLLSSLPAAYCFDKEHALAPHSSKENV